MAATVLLLGNYRPTIALVRALFAVGHRVIVGRGGEGGAEYSRFTSEVWDHPAVDGRSDAFLCALAAFLRERSDVGVVFPVSEECVRVVSAGRLALPADRIYVLPDPEVVATMLDKVAAYRIAEAAGVPVAPWERVERREDLASACHRVGYPVVVRPIDSTRRLDGHKAIIVGSPARLARSIPAWPDGHPALLVQRKVVGRRHNLYFAARGGQIVRLLAADVDRTDQADGTGLAVAGRTVVIDAALGRYTAALAERLAYHGVGCAQFLLAPDGRASFLELNPRVGGNHAITEAAGLGLGVLAVALAARAVHTVPVVVGRSGLAYAWTYGDLRGLRNARARGLPSGAAIAWGWDLLRSFVTADFHLTWRWDDPLPTLVLYGRQIPGLRRLLRWRAPRLVAGPATRVAVGETRP